MYREMAWLNSWLKGEFNKGSFVKSCGQEFALMSKDGEGSRWSFGGKVELGMLMPNYSLPVSAKLQFV